ncbi:DNA adenine methylase [Fructilactobacillus cliffordii]|uniref:DNA adenine methylase n=1 Tax=Fructilactobacillus cliffordii TaxID=2940299 RepID=UPI002093ECAB|nr:DNA adenine methylase [Fructilactobacillus cliffordii]USS86481.1 DNA adenine methylase [Fructilactobacillus cliffordii]
MLKLDKSKIRKGKALGLPYMGSKRKIAKQIVEIIKQNYPQYSEVYDLFGGGGTITAELLLNGYKVHYNDADPLVAKAFEKALTLTDDELKSLICSREEFYQIKDKQDKTAIDKLKLLINSFGNRCSAYANAEKVSDLKYSISKSIICDFKKASHYKEQDAYKKANVTFQLDQITRTLRVKELRKLTNYLHKCIFTSKDFEMFSNLKHKFIYLDPPYSDSAGYKDDIESRKVSDEKYIDVRNRLLKMPLGAEIEEDDFVFKLGTFKNNKNRMYYRDVLNKFKIIPFYDWAIKMSQNNIVLISSYEINDPRFKCVFEFKSAHSTLNSNKYNGKQKDKHEKLFMANSEAANGL